MLATPNSRAILHELAETLAASATAQRSLAHEVMLGCSELWILAMVVGSRQAREDIPARLQLLDVYSAQVVQEAQALITKEAAEAAHASPAHGSFALGDLVFANASPTPYWDSLKALITATGRQLRERLAAGVLGGLVVGQHLWRRLRWVLALLYVGWLAWLCWGPTLRPLPTADAVVLVSLWPLLFAVIGYRLEAFPRWTAVLRLAALIGIFWFMREVHRHQQIQIHTSLNIVMCALGHTQSCEHVQREYAAMPPESQPPQSLTPRGTLELMPGGGR
jgi:hypothetical protein